MINAAVRNSIRGSGRQAYPHQVARALPRTGLLLYLGRPNLEAADAPIGDDTEIGDDTIIRWMFLLPADADIRAATGWVSGAGNIFYDAAGDPVAVFASDIADWADINRYNVLFHLVSVDTETGRLAIYALDADHATLNKARRVLREDQYGYWAPLGAILHYDAEVAPLTELAGGVHTLDHSVLGPQYQRLADVSYINVGAQPAVDVLEGGIKGLRTCGAITNLLSSGADDIRTWNKELISVDAPVDGFYKCTPNSTAAGTITRVNKTFTSVSGTTYTFCIDVKYGNIRWLRVLTTGATSSTVDIFIDIANSVVGISNGLACTISNNHICVSFAANVSTATAKIYIQAAEANGTAAFIGDGEEHFFIRNPLLTATPYPVPYVPPGVTQPASNATTTNGTWFALPDGSELWQALTGSPFTLATRVMMGAGSGDLPNNVVANILYTGSKDVIIYSKSTDGTSRIVASDDGASVIVVNGVFVRNAVIQRFTQVNTAGTRFRVGYMIEGTHPTIQWSHPSEDSSTWAVFDGSFNPSTLYRFMLGYNNPYPMWFNKITAWKRQVPTTELEAWA